MAMPVLGRRVRGGTRAEEQREGLDRKNYEGGIGVTHGNGWLGMEMVDLFFLKKIMYLFLERGEERETAMVAFHSSPSWDLSRNPSMCP